MLETINYNKVKPVIQWAQHFITVATIKLNFSFIKKLRIPRRLVYSTYSIKFEQSIVKQLKKVHSKIMFNLCLILILILTSFVNTGPGCIVPTCFRGYTSSYTRLGIVANLVTTFLSIATLSVVFTKGHKLVSCRVHTDQGLIQTLSSPNQRKKRNGL